MVEASSVPHFSSLQVQGWTANPRPAWGDRALGVRGAGVPPSYFLKAAPAIPKA